MVDLNTLIILARVVEARGISEAARRLGMPTSTVSRRGADREEGLGVRLLERSTRSLRRTEIGAEVDEQARLGSDLGVTTIGSSPARAIWPGAISRTNPPTCWAIASWRSRAGSPPAAGSSTAPTGRPARP